jgi:spore coat polysaccharide biosynthesis protein SpsF (cytidylyltransferase family)
MVEGALLPTDNVGTGRGGNRMSGPTEKIIFITVSGGVAYVCEDTVPAGVRVEIIDFDNLNDSPDEHRRLSPEARAYVRTHFT